MYTFIHMFVHTMYSISMFIVYMYSVSMYIHIFIYHTYMYTLCSHD